MAPIKGNAVLFSEMTPPPGNEDVFNAWYDNHHMPSHVKGVPGFLSGQRYKSSLGPHYLAVYELDSVLTLESQEYKSRKFTPDPATKAVLDSVGGFTRYIGEEEFFAARPGIGEDGIRANIIVANFYSVPYELHRDFNNWLDTEHTHILLECPAWLMVRRLTIVDANPEPMSHMVLNYINDEAALESDPFKRAHATDWYKRMSNRPWFTPHRVVYHHRGKRVLKDD